MDVTEHLVSVLTRTFGMDRRTVGEEVPLRRLRREPFAPEAPRPTAATA